MLEEIAKNAWHIPILMGLVLIYGLLLNVVLFRPIRRVLTERAQRIKEAGVLSEQSRESLTRRFAEYEQAVLEAHRKGTHLKEEARAESAASRAKVLGAVKAEMDQDLRKADDQLKADVLLIQKELEAATPQLVNALVSKVLGREVAA